MWLHVLSDTNGNGWGEFVFSLPDCDNGRGEVFVILGKEMFARYLARHLHHDLIPDQAHTYGSAKASRQHTTFCPLMIMVWMLGRWQDVKWA
jgi:hypothetical protein